MLSIFFDNSVVSPATERRSAMKLKSKWLEKMDELVSSGAGFIKEIRWLTLAVALLVVVLALAVLIINDKLPLSKIFRTEETGISIQQVSPVVAGT